MEKYAVALTWETNVNVIVAYVSRAFVLFVIREVKDFLRRPLRAGIFSLLGSSASWSLRLACPGNEPYILGQSNLR